MVRKVGQWEEEEVVRAKQSAAEKKPTRHEENKMYQLPKRAKQLSVYQSKLPYSEQLLNRNLGIKASVLCGADQKSQRMRTPTTDPPKQAVETKHFI
ncbi:hypothetical protein STEG23_022660 [Scotinomys teguina]